MATWVPDELWTHRAVRRLEPAGRYFAVRLLSVCDQWGRFDADPLALADAFDVDDDDVTRWLASLSSGARPLFLAYSYQGGAFGAVVGWDAWQSGQFLRDRSKPRLPPVPLDVWERCRSTDVWRLNRDGSRPGDGELWAAAPESRPSAAPRRAPDVPATARTVPDTSGDDRARPGMTGSTPHHTTPHHTTHPPNVAREGAHARGGYDTPADIIEARRPMAEAVLRDAGIHPDVLRLATDAVVHGSRCRQGRNGAVAPAFEPDALARALAPALVDVQGNRGARSAHGDELPPEAAAAEGRAILAGVLRWMLTQRDWPGWRHKVAGGWIGTQASNVRRSMHADAKRRPAQGVRMCGPAPDAAPPELLTAEEADAQAASLDIPF